MCRSLVSILFLLSASPLRAQTPSLEPGTLLRVTAPGGRLEGNLVRWEADTLVVWGKNSGSTTSSADRAIAVSDVERLELGVPRSGWGGAGRGALWGTLAGSLVGVVAGMAAETDCFLCFSSRGEAVTAGVVVFGGLGAGVGALVGAAWPGTRWEPFALPSSNETRSMGGGTS